MSDELLSRGRWISAPRKRWNWISWRNTWGLGSFQEWSILTGPNIHLSIRLGWVETQSLAIVRMIIHDQLNCEGGRYEDQCSGRVDYQSQSRRWKSCNPWPSLQVSTSRTKSKWKIASKNSKSTSNIKSTCFHHQNLNINQKFNVKSKHKIWKHMISLSTRLYELDSENVMELIS